MVLEEWFGLTVAARFPECGPMLFVVATEKKIQVIEKRKRRFHWLVDQRLDGFD
jgi:hypothetical protein